MSWITKNKDDSSDSDEPGAVVSRGASRDRELHGECGAGLVVAPSLPVLFEVPPILSYNSTHISLLPPLSGPF